MASYDGIAPGSIAPGGYHGLPTSPPAEEYPVPTSLPPSPKLFSFSLTFWRQIAYFGVGACNKSWFVSLLDRLTEMGKEPVEDLKAGKEGLRFHPIEWNQRNIPIKKNDFATKEWLGEDFFVENDLFQFHVSRAKGRVIGFFDEMNVFQIVLLDIDHNAQPSKKKNYQVTRNAVERSEYEKLVVALEKKSRSCHKRTCPHAKKWEEVKGTILPRYDDKATVVVGISQDALNKFHLICCEHGGVEIEDIFELGLDACSP